MAESSTEKLNRRGRLLWWFVVGFLFAFIGMLLFVRTYSMLPSGNGVASVSLWRFYAIEIQRAYNSSGFLGPTTSNGTAAITTFVQHVLCSAVGGAVMLGIRFAVGKLKE